MERDLRTAQERVGALDGLIAAEVARRNAGDTARREAGTGTGHPRTLPAVRPPTTKRWNRAKTHTTGRLMSGGGQVAASYSAGASVTFF